MRFSNRRSRDGTGDLNKKAQPMIPFPLTFHTPVQVAGSPYIKQC